MMSGEIKENTFAKHKNTHSISHTCTRALKQMLKETGASLGVFIINVKSDFRSYLGCEFKRSEVPLFEVSFTDGDGSLWSRCDRVGVEPSHHGGRHVKTATNTGSVCSSALCTVSVDLPFIVNAADGSEVSGRCN